MMVDVEEAKAGLIDDAASQIREHLPRGDVAQAERFLRQYYAQVVADAEALNPHRLALRVDDDLIVRLVTFQETCE